MLLMEMDTWRHSNLDVPSSNRNMCTQTKPTPKRLSFPPLWLWNESLDLFQSLANSTCPKSTASRIYLRHPMQVTAGPRVSRRGTPWHTGAHRGARLACLLPSGSVQKGKLMLSHVFGGSHFTTIQLGTLWTLWETDRLPFTGFMAGKWQNMSAPEAL